MIKRSTRGSKPPEKPALKTPAKRVMAKAPSRGSKPGEKRGGRKTGSKNKVTKEQVAKTIAILQEADLSPLEVMIMAMKGDPKVTPFMLQAATAAAPFMHPRLSSVDMNANVSRSAKDLSEAELIAIAGSSLGAIAEAESEEGSDGLVH